MPRALWIPDLLADFGVRVKTHDGWETRGPAEGFDPKVVVVHHTATKGSAVKVCITGHGNLPGPLCHVVLARDGVAHVIASGRANHAGSGGWMGYQGNRRALGIEADNDGSEPWPAMQLVAFHLVSAALLHGIDQDPSYLCAHREWTPRKVDPHSLDMAAFRASVGLDLHAYRTRGDDMTDDQDQRLKRLEEKVDKLANSVAGFATLPDGKRDTTRRSLLGRIGDALKVG